MKHLKQLTASLAASNLFKKEQFESWAEDIRIIPLFENGAEGYRAAQISYKAMFDIEKFDNKKDENILFIILAGYIQENDNDRQKDNLGEPELQIDNNGDETLDIGIEVNFLEDIYLIPADDGIFSFYGVRYNLGQQAAVEIEEINVSVSV